MICPDVRLSNLRAAALVLCAIVFLAACSRPPAGGDFAILRGADPFFNKFISPDPELLWRLNPGRYNAKELLAKAPGGAYLIEAVQPEAALEISPPGLRGGDPGPKAGRWRILCLGDSVTFGYLRPYPEVLEQLLGEKKGAGSVQVINAGVPGYSLAQGARWFSKYGPSFEPDVVVALFGWNDAKERIRGYTDSELMGSPLRIWLARWRTSLEWIRWRGGDPFSEVTACCRVTPRQEREGLRRLSESVRGAGAYLHVASYPSLLDQEDSPLDLPKPFADARRARLKAFEKVALEESTAGGFGTIALAAEVAAGPGLAYYRDPASDPVHPSEEGAKFLAGVVAGALLPPDAGAKR